MSEERNQLSRREFIKLSIGALIFPNQAVNRWIGQDGPAPDSGASSQIEFAEKDSKTWLGHELDVVEHDIARRLHEAGGIAENSTQAMEQHYSGPATTERMELVLYQEYLTLNAIRNIFGEVVRSEVSDAFVGFGLKTPRDYQGLITTLYSIVSVLETGQAVIGITTEKTEDGRVVVVSGNGYPVKVHSHMEFMARHYQSIDNQQPYSDQLPESSPTLQTLVKALAYYQPFKSLAASVLGTSAYTDKLLGETGMVLTNPANKQALSDLTNYYMNEFRHDPNVMQYPFPINPLVPWGFLSVSEGSGTVNNTAYSFPEYRQMLASGLLPGVLMVWQIDDLITVMLNTEPPDANGERVLIQTRLAQLQERYGLPTA